VAVSSVEGLEGGRGPAWEDVLGMNARTLLVERENPAEAIRLVNSKCATKNTLYEAGIPYPKTLALIENRFDLANLDWEALPDGWAIKPDFGRRGSGILLARRRDGDGWRTGSGRYLSGGAVEDHLRFVLDGEFSADSLAGDRAFVEPLIVPDPTLARLSPAGLPDVRLICYRGEVLLGMVRLPTHASEGRANLHQGAIGAAVDLATGRVTRALSEGQVTGEHPDTGEDLVGVGIPDWGEVLEMARRCGPATGLGYVGVDVVVDESRGPLVLEVNARPGLEIQNITGVGLAGLLRNREGPA
jgi:alpha-L-glutamate ligase-like protein